jgi:hypothetical protein
MGEQVWQIVFGAKRSGTHRAGWNLASVGSVLFAIMYSRETVGMELMRSNSGTAFRIVLATGHDSEGVRQNYA